MNYEAVIVLKNNLDKELKAREKIIDYYQLLKPMLNLYIPHYSEHTIDPMAFLKFAFFQLLETDENQLFSLNEIEKILNKIEESFSMYLLKLNEMHDFRTKSFSEIMEVENLDISKKNLSNAAFSLSEFLIVLMKSELKAFTNDKNQLNKMIFEKYIKNDTFDDFVCFFENKIGDYKNIEDYFIWSKCYEVFINDYLDDFNVMINKYNELIKQKENRVKGYIQYILKNNSLFENGTPLTKEQRAAIKARFLNKKT